MGEYYPQCLTYSSTEGAKASFFNFLGTHCSSSPLLLTFVSQPLKRRRKEKKGKRQKKRTKKKRGKAEEKQREAWPSGINKNPYSQYSPLPQYPGKSLPGNSEFLLLYSDEYNGKFTKLVQLLLSKWQRWVWVFFFFTITTWFSSKHQFSVWQRFKGFSSLLLLCTDKCFWSLLRQEKK